MDGKIQGIRDKVVLLLVNGMSVEAAEAFCVQQGTGLEGAKQTVSEARKRLTVAADYARDEQLGRAVMRLDDLYAKSITGHDLKTALQAQRELNRLLDLYAGTSGESSSDADLGAIRRQLELIASYLLPLGLAGSEYPVEEHARLAADLIRTHELNSLQNR